MRREAGRSKPKLGARGSALSLTNPSPHFHRPEVKISLAFSVSSVMDKSWSGNPRGKAWRRSPIRRRGKEWSAWAERAPWSKIPP